MTEFYCSTVDFVDFESQDFFGRNSFVCCGSERIRVVLPMLL